MAEQHSDQTATQSESRTAHNGGSQGSREAGSQEVAQSAQQQGGNLARQESFGREGRALRRQGPWPLASQSPFAAMRQLSREMDRLMDSFFERGFGLPMWDPGSRDDNSQFGVLRTPQIDVQQREDAIIVRADLPGVRKEDVQVEVKDQALVISGQRREDYEEGDEDRGYRSVERRYGSFYQTVPLPQGTNPEQITAEMRDGVLKVKLPLSENARPRRIQVQG
jgi:HSP20 family protein